MGQARKNSPRRSLRNPNLDLLGAAFGLPFFRKVERNRRKVPHIAIDYEFEYSNDGLIEESVTSSENYDNVSLEHSSPAPSVRTYSTPQRRRHRRRREHSVASTSRRRPRRYRSVSSRPPDPISSKRSFTASSTSRRSSERRSTPVRYTASVTQERPVASFVQQSAPFPSHMPVNLSSNPICIIQPSPSVSDSTLRQPFATFPVQTHQQMYSQPPIAFIPAPQLVQIPQYAPTSFAQPIGAYPQTVPQRVPQQVVPQKATRRATQQGVPRQAVQHTTLESQDKQLNRTSTGWAGGSGPFSHQLERIQMDIDQKMALLAQQPRDPALRADLRKLQDQLNVTLNAAIAMNRTSMVRTQPQTMAATAAQPGGHIGKSDEVVDDLPIVDALPSHSEGHISIATANAGRYPKGKRSKRRKKSFDYLRNSHICSGCGCARSSQFQDKHPYMSEISRVTNYCKICRARKIGRGVVGSTHFCFGCGQGRSKSFQREHPILPGDPMLPNYCIICMDDLRAEESLAETSVLDLNLETDTNQGSVNGSTENDSDSLRGHIHGGKDKHKGTEIFPANEVSHYDLAQEEVRARGYRLGSQTRRRTNPSNFDTHKSTQKCDDSPSLRHCAGQDFDSTELKSQRRPPGRIDKDHGGIHSKEAPRKYKAPFVEESKSAPQSPQGTTDPELASANKPWKGGEVGATDRRRDSSLPVGVGEEFESSGNSNRARKGDPPKQTTHWDKTADSDLSAGSRKSSLKSSGSKTVRFRQSVDIQTPCEPGFKHDKSPIGNPHLETGGNGVSENPRPGSSPLFHNRSKPRSATTQDAKYSGHRHFGLDDVRSATDRPAANGNNFQMPSSIPWSATSPGFSQGAFSRGFNSPEESPRGMGGLRSHGSPSERMGDFPRKSPHGRYADEFPETPKSQSSFRTSGFGSFFNKHGNNDGGKGTDPSGSMPSSPPPYGTWTAFTDPEHGYFAEDESMLQGENDYSKNPYYTRRQWGFASSSEWSRGKESEGAIPSWQTRRTAKRWSRPCDAVSEPIIEEASSVGVSSPEVRLITIEYTVTDSSSEGETSDATEIEEFTSDDEVDEADIITEGAMRLLKSGARLGPQKGI
ncbi:hypothetical protein B0J13DRAFT_634158 [Dactylonectria estremocensis]|uniref:Uncharacterized protein n=1 Tax=Dactylonectria estremocensis TaxID=1079267 RepID=A0A9P9FIP2_9HYPO|nr:hypothetical protein B0J13DRAFT_634158 [Dactylonectria estremocensis]